MHKRFLAYLPLLSNESFVLRNHFFLFHLVYTARENMEMVGMKITVSQKEDTGKAPQKDLWGLTETEAAIAEPAWVSAGSSACMIWLCSLVSMGDSRQ